MFAFVRGLELNLYRGIGPLKFFSPRAPANLNPGPRTYSVGIDIRNWISHLQWPSAGSIVAIGPCAHS